MALRTQDIVCRQAVELMAGYLDGALSRRDRRRLERHLRGCPNCSAYLEQIRTTIEITGTVGPDDLEPGAVDELVELYRRWRAHDGGDG